MSLSSFSKFHFLKVLDFIGRQGLGGPPTKAMLMWSCGYIPICLSIFLCLIVGFRPHFHSVWSCPLCNCLVKKISQGTDVLTHNCLPPLLALRVLMHVCMRLIILTSSKNNHKTKIAMASWQLAFAIQPFDCEYTNILIVLTACIF